MDTFTHIALGACIGEAILSKQIGKKALAIGAVAQSIPDVDVLAAAWLPPAENLLVHRGITHSFLFAMLTAAVLSIFISKTSRFTHLSLPRLFLFFCFQICLHDLLDTCNAYGTGLFEPFNHHRYSLNLLYVADPFFSFSLGLAFVALIVLKSDSRKRKRWVIIGLLPCCLYFFYGVTNKITIDKQAQITASAQHLPNKKFMTTPTPLNTWLWYIVFEADSGYYVGYRSVFEGQHVQTSFQYYAKNKQLLQTFGEDRNVEQLKNFASDWYVAEQSGDTLIFNVLRFGQVMGWQNKKAEFAFRYIIDSSYDNSLVMQKGRFKGWNAETVRRMYNRIKGNTR